MFSIVIVTFNKDFEKVKVCLSSIQQHLLDRTTPVFIILNDNIGYVEELTNIVNRFHLNTTVLHCQQVAQWDNDFDWWSQQYFKLAAADIVSTPWYLVIDSDDVITKDITIDQLFNGDKAKCLIEDYIHILNSSNPELKGQLQQAYNLCNLTHTPKFTMGNLTPFMLNTKIVKRLAHEIPLQCFNVKHPQLLTLEFYLYYAYLDQQLAFESLYSPTRYIDYAVDKRK